MESSCGEGGGVFYRRADGTQKDGLGSADEYGDPKSPPRVDRGGYIVAGGNEGNQAMPDEQPTELVAKIVGAYLRRNQVPPDQLASLITTVYQALGGLGKPATEAVVERTPAVSIRRSVHHDHVVCLDCGWRGQMLRRHVTTAHGLTVEQYRARWNLPADHAMTAPAYSERRSTMAKQIGLGRGGRRGSVEAPEPAAPETSAAAPRRRGRPRSAATPA
jgi:predicted transcriptional regulator